MKGFKPMFDKILVKRTPPGETAAGIALPVAVTTLELMDRGVVVAVGPGRRNEAGVTVRMVLKGGETVVFMRGAGYPLDEEYIVLHEADVMGTE